MLRRTLTSPGVNAAGSASVAPRSAPRQRGASCPGAGAIPAQLARIALALRVQRTDASPTTPRFVDADDYWLRGRTYRRLRIMLRGNGCSVPTCTMCPLPNQGLDHSVLRVTAEQYVAQLAWALSAYPGCELVCVYNDGNFFADRELSAPARKAIYERVRCYGARCLMVESLPAFITSERLAHARGQLGDVGLIVGVGLQSATRLVRELCINAPLRISDFMSSLRIMKQHGVLAKVYLLVKAPFLTEREAVQDVVRGALWLNSLGVDDVTLCPTRVAPGTVLQDMHDRGLYRPPVLSTIVHCLSAIRNGGGSARVSVFNVRSSDCSALTPGGCDSCEVRIMQGLIGISLGADNIDLCPLMCARCDKEAEMSNPPAFAGLAIEQRVALYMEVYGRRQSAQHCVR